MASTLLARCWRGKLGKFQLAAIRKQISGPQLADLSLQLKLGLALQCNMALSNSDKQVPY